MMNFKKKIVHYIEVSFESILTDQLASMLFGAIVTWTIENKIHIFDSTVIPTYLKFLILAVLFLCVYMLSVLLQMRPHRFKFHFKSVEILVEYLGNTVNVYNTYSVKPNRLSVSTMFTRRTWYSNEKFNFQAMTNGYEIKEHKKQGYDNEYYIFFPHPQYFWQTRTFKTKFSGANKKRQFKNFYQYDVICPIDKMTLEVRMPQEYCAKDAKLRYFYDHDDSIGSTEEKVEFNGCYKWVIDSPKLGWSYQFEWTWSEDEAKKINHYQKVK